VLPVMAGGFITPVASTDAPVALPLAPIRRGLGGRRARDRGRGRGRGRARAQGALSVLACAWT